MHLNPHKNKIEFIVLIALMMALNAVAIDIMLPALPIIGDELGATSDNDQQLMLTLYLVGFGLSQLFYGPLSDSIGRRPVVFIGTILFLVPVAVAPLSPDYSTLLMLRFSKAWARAHLGSLPPQLYGTSLKAARWRKSCR